MTGSREIPPSYVTALLIAGCVWFAVPLAAHAYAGTTARYVGDDYCAGYIFRDYGVIGAQWWFYKSWGAVPSTVLLMALTDLLGPRSAAVWPALAIVSWVAAGAWAVRRIARLSGRSWGRLPSLLAAEVIVFATIEDAPSVIQSMYLRVPMLAYTVPLIVATVYAGLLASWCERSARTATTIASGAVAFVAGAFGPVYVAMQTVALGAGILFTAVTRDERARSMRRLLAAGVIGSVASLAFVALAPGNSARQLHFPHPPSLPTLIEWSVLYGVFMFARPLLPLLRPAITALAPRVLGAEPAWLGRALEMSTGPATLIIAAGIPALIVWSLSRDRAGDDGRGPRSTGWMLIALPITALVLVVAAMAPGAYGTSTPPPPRALIIPQFAIVCLAALWGCAAVAQASRVPAAGQRVVAGLLVLLAAGQPMISARRTWIRTQALEHWASRWDETDRQLRLARERGEMRAVVPALDSVGGVGSISTDAGDWVNACAARYYGLESIEGRITP